MKPYFFTVFEKHMKPYLFTVSEKHMKSYLFTVSKNRNYFRCILHIYGLGTGLITY